MFTFFDGDQPEAHPAFAVVLGPMVGQACWRLAVRDNRSLSIGFGAKAEHRGRVYGAWEIGNYVGAWRVLRNGSILVASSDAIDSVKELESNLDVLRGKSFERLSRVGRHDVAAQLTDGLIVEFLATISYDDETFHLFAPDNMFISYSVRKAWECSRTDVPVPDDR